MQSTSLLQLKQAKKPYLWVFLLPLIRPFLHLPLPKTPYEPHAPSSMSSAPCPMPSTPCPMHSALWFHLPLLTFLTLSTSHLLFFPPSEFNSLPHARCFLPHALWSLNPRSTIPNPKLNNPELWTLPALRSPKGEEGNPEPQNPWTTIWDIPQFYNPIYPFSGLLPSLKWY